jgi:ABC-type transport system involved in multi-copper enzyme maturation permease subunit
MRNLVRAGESAFLMLVIMFVGSLVLWVGMPLAALFVGSRVQSATDSIGVAMLAMAGVVIGSLVVLLPFLGWLNRKHMEVRVARGRQDLGSAALEGVIVVSATVAVVAFAIWFFFFAGSSPIPFQGSGQ